MHNIQHYVLCIRMIIEGRASFLRVRSSYTKASWAPKDFRFEFHSCGWHRIETAPCQHNQSTLELKKRRDADGKV